MNLKGELLLHTFLRDTDGIGQFLRGVHGMSFEQLEDFLPTFQTFLPTFQTFLPTFNILTSQTVFN